MERVMNAVSNYCNWELRQLPKSYVNAYEAKQFKFQPLKLVEEDLFQKCGVCTPKARSGHRMVCTEAAFYSFGGYNPDIPATDLDMDGDPYWKETDPLFRELWEFRFSTRSWRKVPCSEFSPTALASHSAALCGPQSLLAYGGTGMPFGYNSSNKLYHCNLRTGEWKEVETRGEAPTPQYGQAVVIKSPYMYVIGGTTGFDYSLDVHRLNFSDLKWETLCYDQALGARYRHEVALCEDDIFVFGGGTNESEFPLETLPVFNVQTHKWRLVPTTKAPHQFPRNPRGTRPPRVPPPRRCHALVQLGDDVVIMGGTDGRRGFSDFWKINLRELVWIRLCIELPHPLYFHSAAVTSAGKLWIFGGVKSVDEISRSKSVFSVWLKVPQLQEMAWEGLLYYNPGLPRLKDETLRSLGIPEQFIRRCTNKTKTGNPHCYCAIYRHMPGAGNEAA